MKCIEIQSNKLVLAERDMPKPQKGEVLIKVLAAGVNRPDILQRRGHYTPPPGASDIPGLEVVGEIVEFGRGAKGRHGKLPALKLKMKVVALVTGGGYAEYCIAPAATCLPLPKGMDPLTAACIPETFFTVWTNLFDSAKLQKGETLLVHGGGSGIGTAAIQIAKSFGVKVFVTCGSESKCQRAKKLGADLAIHYTTQDFVEEVMRATKDRGVDVVLDMIGGDYMIDNLTCLAKGGRHISIAMQHGREAEVDIWQIMEKRLTLTGSTLRPRTVEEKMKIAEALYQHLWPLMKKKSAFFALFSKKRIAPVVDREFLLSDAQAAHDYLDSGEHFGKVVLRIA